MTDLYLLQRPDDTRTINKIVDDVLADLEYTKKRGSKADINDLLKYVVSSSYWLFSHFTGIDCWLPSMMSEFIFHSSAVSLFSYTSFAHRFPPYADGVHGPVQYLPSHPGC